MREGRILQVCQNVDQYIIREHIFINHTNCKYHELTII